jgi:hypothetical protein
MSLQNPKAALMCDRTWLDPANVVITAKKAKNFGNGGNHRPGGVNSGHKGFHLKC